MILGDPAASDAARPRARPLPLGGRVAEPQPQRRVQSAPPQAAAAGIAAPAGFQPAAGDAAERGGSPSLSESLAAALGLPLTRGNAVWGAGALEKLRGLQHALMKCAFGLPPQQRAALLQAVKVLELAVALRLRFEACLMAEQEMLQRGQPGCPWDAGGHTGERGGPPPHQSPPPTAAQRPRTVL